MILSCLPGASLVPPRLSKMILSCLPGASLVPRRLSKLSFPARWCLPGASPGCPKGPFLPGASPVSKCFSAASRVSVAQGPLLKAFVAQIPLLKALVAWPPGSNPDFGRAPDFV